MRGGGRVTEREGDPDREKEGIERNGDKRRGDKGANEPNDLIFGTLQSGRFFCCFD